MSLDISTVAFITSIVFASSAIAVFVQYRVNRTYKGLEWWLIGAVLQALGFLLMLALKFQAIWMLSIIANPLVLLGQIFLFVGMKYFLGNERGRWTPAPLFAVYIVCYFYFIFVRNSISGRSVTVSVSAMVISWMIAYTIFHGKKKYFSRSANFTASVFFVYGFLQTVVTAGTLFSPPLSSYRDASRGLFHATAFMIPMVGNILWSFGFILMVNQKLNVENLEEKEKLRLIFYLSPDAKLITRLGDGLLVDVNEIFLSITGYAPGDILGTAFLDTNIWDDETGLQSFTAELKDKGIVENREFIFRRKDGSRFVGLVSGRVLSIQDQAHAIFVIRDITKRKLAEQRVKDLLAEKELILKEVHHRIKNNMSTVYSLLSLQAEALPDPASSAALEEVKNRIQSMMMLYETLYKSANFTEISVKDYLPSLIDKILSNFPRAESVHVEKDIDDFILEITKLQPLGMILNELLTNIMKYAFVGRENKTITVAVKLLGQHVNVVVQDNGKGMPKSVDFEKSTGFGMMLVGALTSQLDGTIRIERENGTKILLEFRAYKTETDGRG